MRSFSRNLEAYHSCGHVAMTRPPKNAAMYPRSATKPSAGARVRIQCIDSLVDHSADSNMLGPYAGRTIICQPHVSAKFATASFLL
jgi:hypothetical protein